MNKLNVYMTDSLLKEYAEKYFDELTFADFALLSERNINISSNLFEHKLELLKNKEIVKYIFKTFKEIPLNIVNEIIKNNIEITYGDVEQYEVIKSNYKLLMYVFEKDVQVITLFPEYFLNSININSALKRNVKITEDDVIRNPALRSVPFLMEEAIKQDPKIIRWITSFCAIQIKSSVINEALDNYKITEEDLLKNPELCKTHSIISKLPEFRMYSYFLMYEDKIAEIKRLLIKKDYEAIKNLPFFKKELEGKASGENIKWLVEFISKEIDEEDVFEQRNYQKVLDNIIDGVVTNNYNNSK